MFDVLQWKAVDERTSDRKFGFVFFAALIVLSLVQYQKKHHWEEIYFFIASAFLFFALIKPIFLRPLNIVWCAVGLGIGFLTQPIVLGLVYFLILVPFGVVLKILDKDLLNLKLDPKAKSYWEDRLQISSSMKNQF